MEPPIIQCVDKEEIYPAFGYADPEKNLIQIRADLPLSVKNFILKHEMYHLTDRSGWWVWREAKASLSGAWKHPIGFFRCVILSLSPDRLKFYVKRFRKKE
jgi:hypothetical protein